MLVLVSPTKTQNVYPGESINDSSFMKSQQKILKVLQSYDYEDLKKNMKISDKIATALLENLNNFDESNIAVHTYQGASFKPLDVDSWDKEYAQDHFGILSALYGIVKPFNPIGLYRLDFLMTFDINLYDEWQDQITDYLNLQNKTIVSLASQEYEKMILTDKLINDFIRLDFKEHVDGKYVTKSTYAKTARGKAANHIIANKIQSIEDLKEMSFDNYKFNKDLSSATEIIFTR